MTAKTIQFKRVEVRSPRLDDSVWESGVRSLIPRNNILLVV